MRGLLLLTLSCSIASAATIDGVDYIWGYDPISSTAGTITVQFSVPISNYQFQVDFPSGSTSQNVWVSTQAKPTVTWATVGGGQWVPVQQEATVAGILPNVRQMEATIGVGQMTGNLFPLNFHFTELVDPPVGAAETPEPSTLALICGGLALTMLKYKSGRRAQSPQ